MTATLSTYLADIRHAAAAKAWYAALAMGLAVPDICGAIAHPEISDSEKGRRYSKWCNTYVHRFDANLIGEDIWTFRCAFLHTGTGDLPRQDRAFRKGALGHIVLTYSDAISASGIQRKLDEPSKVRPEYALPIGHFLELICKGAHLWHIDIATDREKLAQAENLLEIMPPTYAFEDRVGQ